MTYTIKVHCAKCGGDVEEVTNGRSPGFLAAVLKCQDCKDQQVIRLQSVRIRQEYDGLAASRCGTDAGYARHRRNGEKICKLCREAHRLATQLRVEERENA